MLVTGCDPLRIFLYKDGLVRFATSEYEKPTNKNKGELYKHLTNFSINKNNPLFKPSNDVEKEDQLSHKRSLENFFEELRQKGCDVIDQCWLEIKNIIIKTLCAVQPILKHSYIALANDDPFNQGCFELLGFDIILDRFLKPYLLEVNNAPSF